MSRLALIALFAFIAACSDSSAAKPQAAQAPSAALTPAPGPVPVQGNVSLAPRNLVCERLALENQKAPCVPEMTDAGEHHTHTARITLDGQVIVCALNDGQVSAVCGPMFAAPAQQPAQQQPEKATKKK